ncbi:MAG: single-stranded-DNA-specific exonuclease RecJ [Planctomycetes bacterium]|nr:single-stranded-DNA-specific exonuclease RecJ [Planctomycetota bacterium]
METSCIDAAWCIASQRTPAVRELADGLRIPDYVARALINRGAGDLDQARQFLAATSANLEDPFAFRDMQQAVDRVLLALQRHELTLIQGDYDVDGSASAALLVNLFRLLGGQVEVSIPSRAQDGYGLNERIVRRAAQRGVKLMITCDNGTTANAEIALARDLGIETIITDHHTVGETLPPAVAVLNPHVKSEQLKFRDLCGAGVAFKLAWAVLTRLSSREKLDPPFRDFLAGAQSLVALASVADVVPLLGDNRILTRQGLRSMPDSPNPGIRALMETSGLDKIPSGTDVGFKLAPRLNAGGRLGRETLAVELLTAQSYGQAMELAAETDSLNRQRQTLDRELTRMAEDMVTADAGYESERILVVGHDDFHPGVVGIVAARLSRRFNKPAVLVATGAAMGRGSGRSIPGFHLYNALQECGTLMHRFGGHAQAAGLEITRENLGMLRRAVNEIADKHVVQAGYETPTLKIDAEVPLADLGVEGVDILQGLEPFGEGNPEPAFMTTDVEVAAPPKVVGRGTGHLSILLKQQGPAMRGIGFGLGDRIGQFKRGDKVRVVYTPKISTFRGPAEVELELKDIRA